MAPKILPDVAFLRQCFTYKKHTGILRWRRRPRSHFVDERSWKIWNTKHAGSQTQAARSFPIGGIHMKAHRIIWKMVTGEEPPPIIDHKNRVDTDNRWNNLREATQSQNRCNSLGRKNHKHPKGVSPFRDKWQAHICFNGKREYLGLFATPELASVAYQAAAVRAHGAFTPQ